MAIVITMEDDAEPYIGNLFRRRGTLQNEKCIPRIRVYELTDDVKGDEDCRVPFVISYQGE